MTGEWWSRSDEYMDKGISLFTDLAKKCAKIRYLSGTVWSLTRVARGLIDVETCDTSLLDVAAAGLIIEEAGGALTDSRGKTIEPFDMEMKRIVAANRRLHSQLIHVIKS